MRGIRFGSILIAFYLAVSSATFAGDDSAVRFGCAVRDENGFLVHTIQSPFQLGSTKIRVLLPNRIDAKNKYRILFVLPVESRDSNRYGNGLIEVKKANLHNKYGLICVAPTFSHLPWYADHPTDKTKRQETYFLKVVVPFIERTYPALGKPDGRLLVGFSKSGWGAFSLLLRHPDVFGRAAAWDAPLMKDEPNRFGMKPIFGTQENFNRYRLTSLLKRRVDLLKKTNRLVLTGYGNFRNHHRQFHKLMKQLDLKYTYRDGPKREHRWNSGWLKETVDLLVTSLPSPSPCVDHRIFRSEK